MKSYGMAVVLVLAMVVTSLALDVAEIEGRWVMENGSFEFLGEGIGRDGDAYFTYTLADDQLTLNYGAGETAEYTVALIEGNLHLTDAEGNNHTYTSEELGLSPCVINLHKLNAAKKLFAKDHGDIEPTIDDIMAYVPDLPQCPDGGIYTIGPPDVAPRCSVPGHTLEE